MIMVIYVIVTVVVCVRTRVAVEVFQNCALTLTRNQISMRNQKGPINELPSIQIFVGIECFFLSRRASFYQEGDDIVAKVMSR